MIDPTNIEENLFQVRRVIATIAYANGDIDDEERMFLASTIANKYKLSELQLKVLMEDASSSTKVESIVPSIKHPQILRFLIVDLMTLAVTKYEWEETEETAAKSAINAMQLPEQVRESLSKAFDQLLWSNRHISPV